MIHRAILVSILAVVLCSCDSPESGSTLPAAEKAPRSNRDTSTLQRSWMPNFSNGVPRDITAIGEWEPSDAAIQNRSASNVQSLKLRVEPDDLTITYVYTILGYTSRRPAVDISFRKNASTKQCLFLRFRNNQAELRYFDGSKWQTFVNQDAKSKKGTAYRVHVEVNGSHLKVSRQSGSASEASVFDRTDAPRYDGDRLEFDIAADTIVRLDGISITALNPN